MPALDGVTKLAVTALPPFMATVQLPDPWHAPDQPTKILPVAAVARSVTDAPLLKLAVQVPGQLMPLGLLVMVPDPPPAELTCRAY
ncbi:hypothetical protein B9Z49_09925 [Limnohabitans sp. 2KL-51]|nr:hypothetical protein B9Z49_09925 [Limnohabitans sp. 2KL-51]